LQKYFPEHLSFLILIYELPLFAFVFALSNLLIQQLV